MSKKQEKETNKDVPVSKKESNKKSTKKEIVTKEFKKYTDCALCSSSISFPCIPALVHG